MRLAFVDTLFSWPPNGGADVDLYHVAGELNRLGHTVHLFGLDEANSPERGLFDASALPFPASHVPLSTGRQGAEKTAAEFRHEVDAFRPDLVFVCDSFFLKPYLLQALADYPLMSRFYAHELVCHRDILRFKEGAPCPNHYLATPEACRRCALEHLGPEIKCGNHSAWLREYLHARAYSPQYYPLLHEALAQVRVAITYNAHMAEALAPWCQSTAVIPGGVNLLDFPFSRCPVRAPKEKKVILISGRAEDPAKGLSVLLNAGERLAELRSDFIVQATLPEDNEGPDWFQPVGWRSHQEMRALYAQADICVAPSIWEEPFGLVALEAMATGRPVCVSRVGGLQHIVKHTETGFVFASEDDAELAKQLSILLDNWEMRQRMGAAGRLAVETRYTWENIVQDHYLPLLAQFQSGSAVQQAQGVRANTPDMESPMQQRHVLQARLREYP